MRLGTAIATMMAMIATTIISSMSVKPWFFRTGVFSPESQDPRFPLPTGILPSLGLSQRSARQPGSPWPIQLCVFGKETGGGRGVPRRRRLLLQAR